jgi:hypothetical protein
MIAVFEINGTLRRVQASELSGFIFSDGDNESVPMAVDLHVTREKE